MRLVQKIVTNGIRFDFVILKSAYKGIDIN